MESKHRVWSKLVRDRIPGLIRQDGGVPVSRRLDDADFVAALKTKLIEEATEAAMSGDPDDLPAELADVLEVVRTLAESSGIEMAEIETLRQERRTERGAFQERVFLETTSGGKAYSRLPLKAGAIRQYAALYDQRFANTDDQRVEAEVREWFEDHDHLDKPMFVKLCRWKSPRIVPLCASNTDEAIQQATRAAYLHPKMPATHDLLLGLRGVSYPVASVILHFAHPEAFAILDVRALWSLGWATPSDYTFAFWERYNATAHSTAQRAGVDLRTLDKALWEYSRRHQGNVLLLM